MLLQLEPDTSTLTLVPEQLPEKNDPKLDPAMSTVYTPPAGKESKDSPNSTGAAILNATVVLRPATATTTLPTENEKLFQPVNCREISLSLRYVTDAGETINGLEPDEVHSPLVFTVNHAPTTPGDAPNPDPYSVTVELRSDVTTSGDGAVVTTSGASYAMPFTANVACWSNTVNDTPVMLPWPAGSVQCTTVDGTITTQALMDVVTEPACGSEMLPPYKPARVQHKVTR